MTYVGISYFLCVIAFIYTSMGMYGLSLNYKKRTNQLFFAICTSLSIWSVFHALYTCAKTYESALYFNQLKSIGYCFLYGLLLHLGQIIVKKQDKVSKKFLLFAYLPSFYFLISYLFLGDLSKQNFNIVKTSFGWTSITPKTSTNILFNIYVAIFIALVLRSIFLWRRQLEKKSTIKLARITIILTFLCFGAVFISNIYMTMVLKLPNFHLTVVYNLPPIVMFFTMLLKAQVMKNDGEFGFNEEIDERSKLSIFRILGFFYIACGYLTLLINYFTYYYYKADTFIIMLLCFGAAIMHMFSTKIFKTERSQVMFIVATAVINNLVIYIRYADGMVISIWALFFCYLAISSIFKKSLGGYIIFAASIIFQLVLWYHVPSVIVKGNWMDYIIRIMLLSFSAGMIFFVNKVYRRNNYKNKRYLKTQEMMNKFSGKLMEINVYSMPKDVLNILDYLRRGFNCKRMHVTSAFTSSKINFGDLYFVDSDFVSVERDYSKTIFNEIPDYLERLNKGEVIDVYNVSENTQLASTIKEIFKQRGINGFYAFPVFLENELKTIVAFEFEFNESYQMIKLYRNLLSNLIGETIKKVYREEELFIKANFDEITGLKNRAYFLQITSKLLLTNPEKTYYILYIDIDNFKMINDVFGHSVGDSILKLIGDELLALDKNNNLVTRFGNDDFIMTCADYSREEIEKFINRIISRFKIGFAVSEKQVRFNIAIGVSEYVKDSRDISELIKYADIAMSKAKNLKFKRYYFYDDVDEEHLLEEAKYTEKLFTALDNDEFKLAFQPQVDALSQKVIGAEALIRWFSEDFGFIPPNKFIDILERTGLILEVGEWIIEEAIKQQVEMEQKGINPIRISINLSAVQFLDINLIDKIENLLKKYKANTDYIEFEITESVTINDDSFVNEIFTNAKKLGVSIAIDDFGTGFSSLNRLQSLPLDRLKIDKSFVDGIGVDEKKESVVSVVIELAKSLGLSSIAEGVEDESQLKYLVEHGCDEIQGYYFAKPMYKEEFEEFVKNNS